MSAAEPAIEFKLRCITLAGHTLDYRLTRRRGRSIVMQVGVAGLAVRAPRYTTVREIESALHERADWILRSLDEWQSRRRAVLPVEWKSGAPILYRGRELALALEPSRRETIDVDLFNMTVRHPSSDDQSIVATFVTRWLKDDALRTLVPRAARFAARIRRAVASVKLSNARSEWGSCNEKGDVRLNWRLVFLPPELADYVIAHEIAHLMELNHSRRFWSLVETLYPGHATARRALGDWTALLES